MGLPANNRTAARKPNNTHEVVHRVNPNARVVYVDSDWDVWAHGVQLVGNIDQVYYLHGDFRDVDAILSDATVTRVMDFDRPVGLLLVGLLYFVSDPTSAIARLVKSLPSGSYVAVSHVTADRQSEEKVAEGVAVYQKATEQMHPRSRTEIEQLLTGLEFVPPYDGADPGLCYVGQWGAEDATEADDDPARWLYAGVARKP